MVQRIYKALQFQFHFHWLNVFFLDSLHILTGNSYTHVPLLSACVGPVCAALWFSIGALLELCATWFAPLWVCAIHSPDCCKSSLAGTSSAAPLANNVQFHSWLLAGAVVITQECGSRVVYWVTVVSADSFWVSNSIYSSKLSNLEIMYCVLHVLRLSDLCWTCEPWAVLSFSVCEWANFTRQPPVVLLSGS